jgi:hypothetical protein
MIRGGVIGWDDSKCRHEMSHRGNGRVTQRTGGRVVTICQTCHPSGPIIGTQLHTFF